MFTSPNLSCSSVCQPWATTGSMFLKSISKLLVTCVPELPTHYLLADVSRCYAAAFAVALS